MSCRWKAEVFIRRSGRAMTAETNSGVAYSRVWPSCDSTDGATKALAEGTVDSAARLYAGDPQVAGPLHNTEVTEQTRVNVEVNLGGIKDPVVWGELAAVVDTVDDLVLRAEKVTAAVRDGLVR